MTTLSPRNYKKNMKLSLIPENKIDTVVASPISNTVSEANVFHTESITRVTVFGQEVSLPLSDAVLNTHYHAVQNIVNGNEFCKGTVQCVLATGETTITVTTPNTGQVYANIRLNGTSRVVARGGSTYDAYPSFSGSMIGLGTELTQWVNNNKTSTNNSLAWLYADDSFSMNPWVRRVVVPSSEVPPPIETLPTANDILTTWWQDSLSYAGAFSQNWYDYSNISKTGKFEFYMYPTNPSGDTNVVILQTRIKMFDLSLGIVTTTQRIDDYTFKVTWQVPVRLTYAAASRMRNVFGSWQELDNYALTDLISSIDIDLVGTPFNTDEVSVSYSLDAQGSLTSEVKGQHPFRFESNELITLQSIRQLATSQIEWMRDVSLGLLQFFSNGKYTAEAQVYASWAIANGIQVGTQVYIIQQDGTYVMRGTSQCVFVVKNIEKTFTASEFLYTLSLMER